MGAKTKRLPDAELAAIARQRDALAAEVREHRALLAKIGVAQASMNVETVFLYRFEAPWAFRDGEERLSVAEVIRRQLDRAAKQALDT